MLNLLPWRQEAQRKEKRTTILMLIMAIIVTAVLLFSLRLILSHQVQGLMMANIRLSEKIKETTNLKNVLANQIGVDHLYLHSYKTLERQRLITKVICTIIKLLPGNSFLNSLLLDQNGLLLEGIMLGSNQEVIKNFVTALTKHLRLKFTLLQIKPIEFEKVAFQIHADILNGK